MRGDGHHWQTLVAVHVVAPLQHLLLDLLDPHIHQFLGHVDHQVVLHDLGQEGELA